MIHSILVPLDGSTFSEQALPTAASIARRTGATLCLTRVHVPAGLLPFGGSTPVDAEHEHALREEATTYLERLASRTAEEHDVATSPTLLDGPVVESIDRHAQEVDADLIVMTTHGRSGISRAWLGSVADGLVRLTHRPVLLIRPERTPPARLRGGAFRCVLIPLDGSEAAEAMIPAALSVAGPAGIQVRLLQVVLPTTPADHFAGELAVPFDHTDVEQRTAESEAYLRRVAERMRGKRVDISTRVVTHGQPAVAILEEADRLDVDLIAMATHGRGGVVRLVLGSVADKVLRGASSPLLLLRTEGR